MQQQIDSGASNWSRKAQTKFVPRGLRIASVVNAAHVEWVTHNNAKAIEYYNKAKEICGNADKVAEHIMQDKEALIARGVSETELLLLRDLII